MDGVEGGFAAEDVGFGRLDELGPLEDLPEQVQREVNGDADVGGDEVVAQKGPESIKAVEHDDHGEEKEGEIGRIGLPGGAEDQRAAVHPLRFQRLVELDVCDGDVGPGEQVGDGDQPLEPAEHLRGARRAAHIGQQRDGCRHQHTHVRHSSAIGGSVRAALHQGGGGEERTGRERPPGNQTYRREHFKRICGAWPFCANANRYRLPV